MNQELLMSFLTPTNIVVYGAALIASIYFLHKRNNNKKQTHNNSNPNNNNDINISLSPLLTAISQRNDNAAAALIHQGASPSDTLPPKDRNALFLACMLNLPLTVAAIQDVHPPEVFADLALAQDTSGYTALHAACLAGAATLVDILTTSNSGLVSVAARDGSTPLHTAARRGDAQVVKMLLDKGAQLTACRFGCTPLHTACMYGQAAAVEQILNSRNILSLIAQDHDGLHPTHAAAQGLAAAASKLSALTTTTTTTTAAAATTTTSSSNDLAIEAAKSDINNLLKCLKLLVEAGYPLDSLDYSDATVFYLLCWKAEEPQERAIDFLTSYMIANNKTEELAQILRIRADTNWTCFHVAKQMSGPGSNAILTTLSRVATEINALDLLALDLDEPRNRTHDKYLSRRGAHNTVPEADRRNVLQGLHTIAGVAQHLKRIVTEQKRLPKVVVLCGAGISTNAGIKDFRSSQTGLYSDQRIKQVFNAEFFHNNPKQFYQILSTEFAPLVTHTFLPTLSHAFLSVLEQKEWLLRVYTQNVDGLEHASGVSNDRIVECHGSISRLVCNTCHTLVTDPSVVSQFWAAVSSSGIPLSCSQCSGELRPDIVLFGEPLPALFHQLSFADVSACDLLLVMGTSLVVYPVASLPSYVQPTAVRMLINKEPTGCFQEVAPVRSDSVGDNGMGVGDNGVGVDAHYRDIFYQGDCDAGIKDLADALGMLEILQSTHKRAIQVKA